MERDLTKNNHDQLRSFLERFGIILVALVVMLVFAAINSKFVTLDNLFNITKQISITAVTSIGMTAVFLIGGMDLSAGSNILLSAVITGAFITDASLPTGLAMAIAIAACTVMGLLNGVLIEKFKINSVILTLGSQLLIRGLGLVLLEKYNSWMWTNKDSVLSYINKGTIVGIPVLFFIMALLYAIAYLVFTRTSFGRQIYAAGGNEKAAKLCGLNTSWIKIGCFVMSGVTAGIAGIIAASRLGVVNPSVGTGMEFNAVTAVVLGGVSLKGGEGNVLKTFVGALIVGFIVNFMTLYGVDANYQSVVTGVFILLAAIFNWSTAARKA